LVVLSDKGLALCTAAVQEVAIVETEWRKLLGAARYRQLRDALIDLPELTDPYV
jgi:hypothetical protein